jgi:hypothetical protein
VHHHLHNMSRILPLHDQDPASHMTNTSNTTTKAITTCPKPLPP